MRKTVYVTAIPIFVILFLIGTVLAPSVAKAQISRSYSSNAGVYPVAFDLTVYNPNEDTVYFDTLLLNFSIVWTEFPTIGPFEFAAEAPVIAYYAYSIDNTSSVSMMANLTNTESFYAVPSFSCNLDISKLAVGHHQIALIVQMYYLYNGQQSSLLINQTTSPVNFSVQNSTLQPSPTVPELSWLVIVPLFVFTLVGVFAVRYCYSSKKRYQVA